jgi:hypothetical protein
VTAAHLISFGDDYAPLTNGPEILDVAKHEADAPPSPRRS